MIKTKTICPLKCKCEEVVNNEIQRCNWYINVKGKHPQSEEFIDQWGCAIPWIPTLLVENAQVARGTGAAIESLRNETVKGQANFIEFLAQKAIEKRMMSGGAIASIAPTITELGNG